MKIQRGELLNKLNEVAPGMVSKATIEQSDCFVFNGEWLTTFNDSIMCKVASPLPGTTMAVNAADLLGLMGKMPDEVVDVELADNEFRIHSDGGRSAGITATLDLQSPIDHVPVPEGWERLAEGTLVGLLQASRTCAKKDANFFATTVHVMPKRIEACDDQRYIRVTGDTGFPKRVLLPADAVAALEGMDLARVALGDGWVHFRTAQKGQISLRCAYDDYPDTDQLLKLGNPEKMVLPANLAEILERVEIFNHGGYDFKVGIRLAKNKLVLTARKDTGWYKEKIVVEYTGRPLAFEVNPKFLVEVLGHTRDVLVDGVKLMIKYDRNQFVVCLDAKDQED